MDYAENFSILTVLILASTEIGLIVMANANKDNKNLSVGVKILVLGLRAQHFQFPGILKNRLMTICTDF